MQMSRNLIYHVSISGINHQPTTRVPGSDMAATRRAAVMLANTSAISNTFEKLTCKFDLLFAKRAFVHWYVSEGMEEGEFGEARDDLVQLIMDYKQVVQNTEDGSEGDDEYNDRPIRVHPVATDADKEQEQFQYMAGEYGKLLNIENREAQLDMYDTSRDDPAATGPAQHEIHAQSRGGVGGQVIAQLQPNDGGSRHSGTYMDASGTPDTSSALTPKPEPFDMGRPTPPTSPHHGNSANIPGFTSRDMAPPQAGGPQEAQMSSQFSQQRHPEGDQNMDHIPKDPKPKRLG